MTTLSKVDISSHLKQSWLQDSLCCSACRCLGAAETSPAGDRPDLPGPALCNSLWKEGERETVKNVDKRVLPDVGKKN